MKTNFFKSGDSPTSAGVREIDMGAMASWTLSAPAAVMVSDENILEIPNSPQYPTERRLTLLIPKGDKFPLNSAPLERDPKRMSFYNQPPTPTQFNPALAITQSNTIITLGSNEKNKIKVPIGRVTRFGIPMSLEEIKNAQAYTTKSRKRMYSLANVRNVAGGCKNYDEWIKQVRENVENGLDEGDDYDCISPMRAPKG